MAGQPELNEREILERMRNHVSQSGNNGPEPLHMTQSTPRQFAFIADKGVPGFHVGRMQHEVELVYQLHDAVGTVNPRPSGLLNDAIQRSKNIIARILSWYTRPLHQFHAAVARSLDEQLHALESLQNQVNTGAMMNRQGIDALHERCDQIHKRCDQINDATTLNSQRVDALQEEILKLSASVRTQGLKLRRLERSQFTTDGGEEDQPSLASQSAAAATPMDFDYALFEERFRGNEELIRNRQRSYLNYFEGHGPVLDLGCGRGEFLELLREKGVPGQGVDSSADAVALCHEKDLQVTQADLFAFLERSPDQAAGGIFAAQVIEHWAAEMQLNFIDLCFRKLKPQAPLLIETINPECLFALARNFYLDPTHIRPVHPELLRFALETKGFRDVQVQFSGPVEGKYLDDASRREDGDQIKKAVMELNHFAFGFQDYAVIGWRA